MNIALIVVGIATACLIGYLAWRPGKKRSEALAALAQPLGWLCDSARDRDHDEQYPRIAASRRFLNARIREMSQLGEPVPTNLIATMFGFRCGDDTSSYSTQALMF